MTQKINYMKIIEEEYNKLEDSNARVYVLDFIKQIKRRLKQDDTKG